MTDALFLRPLCEIGAWRPMPALLLVMAMTAFGANGAEAAEYPFQARLDWQSQGEIVMVGLHREFDGALLQTAPLVIVADQTVRDLLDGATIDCRAKTKVGLPNWSVTEGSCTLTRSTGSVLIEIVECAGTQILCEGEWRIVGATGALTGITGSGTVRGHIVDPNPLPWFYNGPVRGFNELTGTVTIP